ncbi:Por secretion system C-terminal sorting domain-containing protein [Mariniphaga anaerophila]|uniref:Por secretion system C-terminal sorting domain-containing protein n=1 Tax=Mariniphaga anaerophila TaxID=1484053 RepID=A0A1M5G1N0_9BACT|nr:chondroitinase family polysaccharide lyase [Mariniphaga anaerophila]SHF97342.1 Por secretion system C-terminal sorting domain-containing protein [Mariniphaga anaerophila]
MKRISIFLFLVLICRILLFGQEYNYKSTLPQSSKPGRIKLDANGTLFVTHPLTHQVLQINIEDASVIAEVGVADTPGRSATLLDTPTDIDTDSEGNIYIADKGNFRIAKFSADLTYLEELELGTKAPEGVTVGPDGKLYICYSGSEVGLAIYNESILEQNITTLSTDRFRNPKKVRFTFDSQLYIVDRNTGIIKVSSFTNEQANVSQLIKKEDGATVLVRNEDCAFSSQGSMIVTSNGDNDSHGLYQGLYRFNRMGLFVDRIGFAGATESNDGFKAPVGIDIDSNDNIYIADYSNSRIQIWEATDVNAPEFMSFNIINNSTTGVTFSFSLNEAGTLYGIIQETSLSAPEIEEIRNPTTEQIAFQVPCRTPNQSINYSEGNLSTNTDYTIYYIAVDEAGNTSSRFNSSVFSTTAQINHLVSLEKNVTSVKLALNASMVGTVWYTIESYSGQEPAYTTSNQIKNSPDGKRCNYPDAGKDIELSINNLSEASIYRISYFIEGENDVKTQVSHYVFSTFNNFEKMLQRYRYWCVGDNEVDYENSLIQARYRAIVAAGEKALGNLYLYDVNNPGNVYDLVNSSDDIKHIRELIRETLFPLALLYNTPGSVNLTNAYYKNPDTERQLMDLFRYLNARGFAEGCNSNFKGGGVYLGLTGYFYASMLMKQELDKAGLLEQVSENMQWWTRWELLEIAPQPWSYEQKSALKQADYVRTFYNNHLMTILTLPDHQLDRNSKMLFLSDIYNESCEISYGWGGYIKPDFTGYHHHGIWGSAYVTEALHVSSQMSMITKDTPYAFSLSALNNLSEAMLAYRFYCNTYDNPVGICGRFPANQGNLLLHTPAFAYLAESDINSEKTVELKGAFNRLMAAPQSFLINTLAPDVRSDIQFRGGIGGLQKVVELYAATEAENSPEGNRTFPYGNLQIHRRNNWMVSVKGFSKYVWDYENNGEQNWFGRNQSAGALEVFATRESESDIVTAEASGWSEAGYDWNHVAGTTTFNLPNWTDHDKSYIWAKFSPESFVGGVSLNKQNGVFALKYVDVRETGWVKRDYKLNANKSYFFFDDQVVCLGSDIQSIHPDYEVHTTLFQNYLEDTSTPSAINGNESTGTGLNYVQPESNPVYLTDVTGNAYFVKNGANLNVTRSLQTSRDNRDKNDTEGNFVKAWINHGKPDGAGYEYLLWVQAPDGRIKELATNPSEYYSVDQKDDVAHIVTHHQKKMTGFAIFKGNEIIDKKHIYSTSDDCLIMTHQVDNNTLNISVAHPDLGWLDKDESLYQCWSVNDGNRWLKPQEQPVEVILSGKWTIAEEHPSAIFAGYDEIKNQSAFLFKCYNGESIDLEIHAENATAIQRLLDDFRVELYPNPSNGVFTLEISKPAEKMEIVSSCGKVVSSYNQLPAGTHRFVHQFKSGVYFIRLTDNAYSATKKLIIQ